MEVGATSAQQHAVAGPFWETPISCHSAEIIGECSVCPRIYGFLALDRNGNGTVDNGKELFGNYTDQPPSDDRNGFRALAVFDNRERGGNGDGILDANDSVWRNLRIWIDENRDGVSQAAELHRLDELGIYSIGLQYQESRRKDQVGNLFRYKGRVNLKLKPTDDQVDRVIYDVFLATGS